MTGLRLVLAGAAIGNGNRGVEALGRSVMDSVDRHSAGARLAVLDDGWGVRGSADPRYRNTHLEYVGARLSRRWHRPESWAQIRAAQAIGSRFNPVARRIATADAIFDLSAGDSFTDLYGATRLAAVSAPKHAAIRAGTPLVLMPQTYGPFTSDVGRHHAEHIVRSATLAYARDGWSYDQLLELAGADADQTRLHSGVDVAFALQPRRPPPEVADLVAALQDGPIAGVNVSGLLRDRAGHERFGLAGDYLDTMVAVVQGLIAAGAQVVLVSHVHTADGLGESDIVAMTELLERLSPSERARTTLLPPLLDASELKWCISKLDWFVGSRMHSTVAALSTLTPAAAYAYSDKTLGVFETCGMGDCVVDARKASGQDAVELLLEGFARRESTRVALTLQASGTIERSRQQLRDIIGAVNRWRDQTTTVGTIA